MNRYALEIVWAESGLPRLVGPFLTSEEAERWGRMNIRNGTWSVTPIAPPYPQGPRR